MSEIERLREVLEKLLGAIHDVSVSEGWKWNSLSTPDWFVEAAAAIASIPPVAERGEWQPIETAPKDGTKIVLSSWCDYNNLWRFRVSYWRKYMEPYGEGFGLDWDATHWMPQPSAQGIVTEGEDPKGLGEAEGRVEPGPEGMRQEIAALITQVERLTAERDEALPYKDELLKISADVGEADDPFAAWESIAAIKARADTLAAENARLREALTDIAAFNDTSASAILAARGSYAGFDEPASVMLAREALAAGEPAK